MNKITYEILNKRLRYYFWINKELYSGIIGSQMFLNKKLKLKIKSGILIKLNEVYKHTNNRIIKQKGQVFINKNDLFSSRLDAETGRKSHFLTKKINIFLYEIGENIPQKGKILDYDVIIKDKEHRVNYYFKK